MSDYVLETRNLTLKIEDKIIFQNVNLKVKKGTIHALIGVNGCGKSSIASVLMGLNKASSGEIFLQNQRIDDLSINERAQRGLTLAWQEPVRFEGLTISDYLTLSAKNKDILLLKEALNSVGLLPEKYLNRAVDETLSGGERKRVELASIFLMKPKIAILDEIDSGVDFIGIDKVLETIKKIAKNGSVLLITHQDEFLKIADEATLLCNGVVLRTGDPQEISKFYKYECTYCLDENNPDLALEELLNVSR